MKDAKSPESPSKVSPRSPPPGKTVPQPPTKAPATVEPGPSKTNIDLKVEGALQSTMTLIMSKDKDVKIESGEDITATDLTKIASESTINMGKESGNIGYLDGEIPEKILFNEGSAQSLLLQDANGDAVSVGSGDSDGLSSASECLEILEKWLPEIRPKFDDLMNNSGLAKIAESID